jgi:hypothetical protein
MVGAFFFFVHSVCVIVLHLRRGFHLLSSMKVVLSPLHLLLSSTPYQQNLELQLGAQQATSKALFFSLRFYASSSRCCCSISLRFFS